MLAAQVLIAVDASPPARNTLFPSRFLLTSAVGLPVCPHPSLSPTRVLLKRFHTPFKWMWLGRVSSAGTRCKLTMYSTPAIQAHAVTRTCACTCIPAHIHYQHFQAQDTGTLSSENEAVCPIIASPTSNISGIVTRSGQTDRAICYVAQDLPSTISFVYRAPVNTRMLCGTFHLLPNSHSERLDSSSACLFRGVMLLEILCRSH